jgi:hypothetical protein
VYISKRTQVGTGSNAIERIPMRTVTGERQMVVYLPGQKLLYSSNAFQLGRSGEFFLPQTLSETAPVNHSLRCGFFCPLSGPQGFKEPVDHGTEVRATTSEEVISHRPLLDDGSTPRGRAGNYEETGTSLLPCLIVTGLRNFIKERNCAPTCSIAWSCSFSRVSSNHSRPVSFSLIQLWA